MRTRAEPPVTVQAWRILALSETNLAVRQEGGVIAAAATKRPVAFVLVDGPRRLAFTATGEPADLDALIARHPDLARALAGA